MADFNAAAIADGLIDSEGLDNALVAFIDKIRLQDPALNNLSSTQLALVATFIVGEQ